MRLIEVNYSLQDLHLEFKKETGEYVENVGPNLSNIYVKWLEEIAIKAKKDALTDEEIRKSIMEELAASEEEESEDCNCEECHCGKIDPEFEKHLDHYMELKDEEKDLSIPEKCDRAINLLAGETISKSFEELQGIGGSIIPTPDRIGFNEHNK